MRGNIRFVIAVDLDNQLLTFF